MRPWTVACQALLSMEFSRPEYWSGLPFPSPGNLPNPGIKSRSPALQADLVKKPSDSKTSYLTRETVFLLVVFVFVVFFFKKIRNNDISLNFFSDCSKLVTLMS